MKKVLMLVAVLLGTSTMVNAQQTPAKAAPAKEVKASKKASKKEAKADKKAETTTTATPAKTAAPAKK